MPNKLALQSFYRAPDITSYNRLECSPRTKEFHRSVGAEIRDPLWMLTRQWQFGEFKGEDAGSAINATIHAKHSIIDRLKLGADAAISHTENIPIETLVEREKQIPNLMVGNQTGRYFINLLKRVSLVAHLPRFILEYPLEISDHAELQEIQFFNLVKTKVPDGAKILTAIKDGGYKAFVSGVADETALIQVGDELRAWWNRMYPQPGSADISPAWTPQQLEYRFSIADGEGEGRKELVADQYFHGHLDWYAFDCKENSSLKLRDVSNKEIGNVIKSFIPTPISFKGMPHTRFWQMEEQTVDFGKMDSSPTGLLHLLFAEFGLIYANDWFIVPYPMEVNTIVQIGGILVTDVFGQHTYIRPAGKDWNSDWQKWAMFQLTGDNCNDNANLLYLPPSLYKSLNNEPTEKVNFVRDEMSNMVWAVEETIPSEFFKGKSGKESSLSESAAEPNSPGKHGEQVKYTLGVKTPSNLTPFIPVHLPGSKSEIRLQRARMVDGKKPKGVLLTEKKSPYFINEEEITRSGVSVTRSFQRTRWSNGEIYLWTGRRKKYGHKEFWSGKNFDQIEE